MLKELDQLLVISDAKIYFYDSENNEIAAVRMCDIISWISSKSLNEELNSTKCLNRFVKSYMKSSCSRFELDLNIKNSNIEARFNSENYVLRLNRWGHTLPVLTKSIEDIIFSFIFALSECLDIETKEIETSQAISYLKLE